MKEVRLERLLGRRVYGPDGKCIGRLEELRAEEVGGEWIITNCHIGTAALLERLSARVLSFPRAARHGYNATWDQIDWESGKRLRLLCPAGDLARLSRRTGPAR